MVEIIPEAPSFGTQIARGLGSGLGAGLSATVQNLIGKKQQEKAYKQELEKQESQDKLENEALTRLIGKDLSGIKDPKIRQAFVDMVLSSAQKEQEGMSEFNRLSTLQKEKFDLESGKLKDNLSTEKKEKLVPFQAGLQTISKMREIGERGRLGRGTGLFSLFGGFTAKDAAEYEQLGKSLISLASNIPIRNQKEFETLAHNLYDPSLPDAAREGILDAMEQIITQNMSPFLENQNLEFSIKNVPSVSGISKRPKLSSFHK